MIYYWKYFLFYQTVWCFSFINRFKSLCRLYLALLAQTPNWDVPMIRCITPDSKEPIWGSNIIRSGLMYHYFIVMNVDHQYPSPAWNFIFNTMKSSRIHENNKWLNEFIYQREAFIKQILFWNFLKILFFYGVLKQWIV